MRRYAREWDEIWKKQFSRVLSHDLLLGKQNIKAKEVYSTMGLSENDCHSDGSKLSNVTSFMILRYEKGLTSLKRNNRANNFGEKSKIKLSGFVYYFRIREKNLCQISSSKSSSSSSSNLKFSSITINFNP